MKFTPYLMVYKETLPIPKRVIRKSYGWRELNSLLKYYYLNVLQQQLRAPTFLTGIIMDENRPFLMARGMTEEQRRSLIFREPHGHITLEYDMGRVPYYIRLKWRLQDLWRKLRTGK